jgi:hypothetical protein
MLRHLHVLGPAGSQVVGSHAAQWLVNGLHTLPLYCGMVVGSKAEEELLCFCQVQHFRVLARIGSPPVWLPQPSSG